MDIQTMTLQAHPPLGFGGNGVHSSMELRGPPIGFGSQKQFMMTPQKESVKYYNASNNMMSPKTKFDSSM